MRLAGRRVSAIAFAAALLVAPAAFGQVVTEPDVDPSGTLIAYPGIGFASQEAGRVDFDWFGVNVPVRYSLSDELSVAAGLGFTFGDFDSFGLGAGGKYQLMDGDAGDPVDLTAGGAFTLNFGDVKGFDLNIYTILASITAGKTLELGGLDVTPYGGIETGFGIVDPEQGDNDTEFAFGFFGGADFDITNMFGAYAEFHVGPTDGIPDFQFLAGINWTIAGGSSSMSSAPADYSYPDDPGGRY